MPMSAHRFDSFFQAGFECSSHRRRDGVRLDLIRATGHDKHVLRDYRLCSELGFRTLRDGLRWHLIEKAPGKYDWSSWVPALEAAEQAGIEIIWDLFHYGSILGTAQPALGGDASFADVIGLNFYPHNQWYLDGPTIPMGHHEYRPLADMLVEVAERYGKPIFLSETGAEGSARASWFHYV